MLHLPSSITLNIQKICDKKIRNINSECQVCYKNILSSYSSPSSFGFRFYQYFLQLKKIPGTHNLQNRVMYNKTTHASLIIMLSSHCRGFLDGQSLPVGLFGSISLMGGLSCGDTLTTRRSNVTTVPIIWTNLKHTKIV